MFKTTLRFELLQHIKKPFTWIFLLLMFLQGLYYMRHTSEFFSADKTYANAPAVLFMVLAGIGYIGFIVTAILGGSAMTKDIEYRTAPLLYTTRAKELSFFGARFSGSLIVLLVLNFGYLLGIILYSYLPIPNLGPLSYQSILEAVLYILLPNIFVLYSLSFAVSVFTKSAKASYGVALMGMLLMIFAETSFNSNPNVVLADPTGFSVMHQLVEHLSAVQKNNYSPEFSGLLFKNRIIWIAISVVMLVLAYKKFSFSTFAVAQQKKEKEKPVSDTIELIPSDSVRTSTPQYFSSAANLKKVFQLSLLEFKTVVRPWGFKLFLSLLLIIYLCYIAVWQQQYYSAAPTLPVTIEITGVTLPLSFYFLLFIIINTGELLFKNKTTGFWQIGDALPVPNWVSIFSKVTAMIGVSFLLTFFLMLIGLLVQTGKGYYHYEFPVYFNDLFIRWMPKYIAYILLTVFVAGITANRYATHWITLFVLISSTVLHEIEVIEQNRFNFIFSPGSGKNTDMNGNGIFSLAHTWYMSYWIFLAVALFIVGLWLWNRGTSVSLWTRIRKSPAPKAALIIGFLLMMFGFAVTGNHIYHTVNIKNHFETKKEERTEKAVYEKQYKKFKNSPQPLITGLELNLQLDPANRNLSYNSNVVLKNTTSQPIDTLHVEWMDRSTFPKIKLQGNSLVLTHKNEELRHAIYTLSQPLLPGQTIKASLSGALAYSGFTNDDPQKEIAFNGSFIPSDIIPFFGYDDRRELKENKYRVEEGLQKINSRLPDQNDRSASARFFASSQAGRFPYTLNISVVGDQEVVAPGILKKSWKKDGKRFFSFASEHPETLNFHILAAQYAVKKQPITINGRKIEMEVYYHPDHAYNVEKLISSAKESLNFLSEKLGAYPYATLTIAERPRYDQELYSYSNVMVLPENHGWIADIRKPEDLDYLRYITAKLIAEQYMQQLNLTRTKGYPVYTKTIPAYLALSQLEHFYGPEPLKKNLEKAHEEYLKGRAAETNSETNLLDVDEVSLYISEHKGGSDLYHLSKTIGQNKLDQQIHTFYTEALTQQSPLHSTNLYQFLLNGEKGAQEKAVKKLFLEKGE
ncbi:hypothetical protein CEY12_07630 [Chryseobacterium sp. T16E-39]|uniref:ABC transporter permease/M1 family aminopeptidase n=1 Tax=Chryseobacterium sp. T16E-39 TaxID=2015076 RepID=UPI000B5B2888|nr:hypothetical protein [Chryseobacterium sp. T16E-39]ASK29985.1 hypothetical protein CEY12_07630 [Chryseobacterium sp. T16E-39]